MRDANVFEGAYKDVGCVVLENDLMRVIVIPEFGSKIASIIYKPLSHELLWQRQGEKYRRTKYGDPYLEGEVSGFDELFPSISRCYYESFPWQGTEIPDHGEVWSVPWKLEVQKNSLQLGCYGVRFPYRLTKKLNLTDGSLLITYCLENLSYFPFDYVWAAHPLFVAEQGMEIAVPKGMKSIINCVNTTRLGRYGNRYSFPKGKLPDGTTYKFDTMLPRNTAHFHKFWFAEKMREGWCILYSKEKKLNIGLCFPQKQVPYLGVFVNEGGLLDQYEIAPEPATAIMDRVDSAEIWGSKSRLEPRGIANWSLSIILDEGPKRVCIDAAGVFQ